VSTTGTSYRKGTSTIMGTLIFVGIIFTAFIPMMLVMRQADTIYEMRKHELEILDQERSSEDIYIYIYPDAILTSSLKVTAQNKGELVTRLVSLWINDEYYPLNVDLQSMDETQGLGIYPLTPMDDESFFITVTTDRGNIIGSDTELIWIDELSGWTTGEVFAVNVLINSLPGNEFKIEVWGPNAFYVDGQTEKFDPKFFLVPEAGDYTVKIYRGSNLLYTKDLTILWPDGSPVEWVFA